MPEFQETKNFESKNEDCQTRNKSKEERTENDKVNNNIQTPEQEIVIQGRGSQLSEDLNIESESSLLPRNEDQTQGDLKI